MNAVLTAGIVVIYCVPRISIQYNSWDENDRIH
jgi:hypothetical protein